MTAPFYVPETFTNNTPFWNDPVKQAVNYDLMNLQAATNAPQDSSNFTTVTDPLLPDRNVVDRLGHFDPDIYDLRDTTHLMKLMQALLGGAGAGGLRKQIAIMRLQNSFHTTHFLDLDHFYGALFGIVRTRAEIMPNFGTIATGTLDDPTDPNKPAPTRYTLHGDADVRTATTASAGLGQVLGEEFLVTNDVSVIALRYWHPADAVVATTGAIFDCSTSTEVPGTRVTFTGPPTAGNWHQVNLPGAVTLAPGRYKVVCSFASSYCYLNFFFSSGPAQNDIVSGPLTLLSYGRATNKINGSSLPVGSGFGFPIASDGNYASYGLDVVATENQGSLTNVNGQFDPFVDAAGSDIWDDVHSRDASYRSRLIKFARAIPQGGTYPGLLAAAEALLDVDCEMYEAWEWIDEIGGSSTVINKYIYAQLDAGIPSWSALATKRNWSDLTGDVVSIGRLNQPNRNEIVLKPKRQLREDEKFQALRVLRTLAPAGTQFTVDSNGLAIHLKSDIRNVAASSEYWEVVSATTPNPSLDEPTKNCYQSNGQSQTQPRPAFSQYSGEMWSYNNDVATVSSYEMVTDTGLTASDYETRTYSDGSTHQYLPSDAMIPGKQAAAARLGCDGVCTSFPYQRPSVSINFSTDIKIGSHFEYSSRAGISPNGMYLSGKLSLR